MSDFKTIGRLHEEGAQGTLASFRDRLAMGTTLMPASVTQKPAEDRVDRFAMSTPGMRIGRAPLPSFTTAQREAMCLRMVEALSLKHVVTLTFFWGSDNYVRISYGTTVDEVEYDAVPVVLHMIHKHQLWRPLDMEAALKSVGLTTAPRRMKRPVAKKPGRPASKKKPAAK